MLRRRSLSVCFRIMAVYVYVVGSIAVSASAQSFFSSGSTGADGAFSPTKDIVIDMNTKPDGIWHYTTINIPSGVTVTFTSNTANTPVVWLASGAVTIAGTINLNGASALGSCSN